MNEKIKENIYKRPMTIGERYVKWLLLGILTGIVVGAFSTVFAKCLEFATSFREAHSYTFLTLPIGGLLIVTIYKLAHMENDGGTDTVIESFHKDVVIPFRQAILIFLATSITIFCGGSVGREGAALQIGASLGNTVSRGLKLNQEDRRILIMAGMSAAFGALFQTPMAAAFFSMEVSSVGAMHYAGIVPCILASLIAYAMIRYFGVPGEHFPAGQSYELTLQLGWRILVLAIGCALLSILFCVLMQLAEKVYMKWMKNKYAKILVGSLLLIVLNILIGTDDYQGTGMQVIERALQGEANTWAFLLKLLFTVVTISAGFKGGEIVPSFFIGATFGCVAAGVIGLPATLGASVGMIALFCGVTNCPIASLLIAIELFGTGNLYFFLLAIATSYMLSGYFSLYHSQVIVYSKSREHYIDKKVGRIWKK